MTNQAKLAQLGLEIGSTGRPVIHIGETNPVTGVKEYHSAREPITAAAAVSISAGGGPPVTLEFPSGKYIVGAREPIDRYALNPAVTYFRAQVSDLPAAAPTMFRFGDLPITTASGLDPAAVRFAPWYLRHAAAYTDSRQLAILIIEESDTPDVDKLQTEAGAQGLGDYFARVWGWAAVPGTDTNSLQGLSEEEIKRFYPPGPSTDDDD